MAWPAPAAVHDVAEALGGSTWSFLVAESVAARAWLQPRLSALLRILILDLGDLGSEFDADAAMLKECISKVAAEVPTGAGGGPIVQSACTVSAVLLRMGSSAEA